MKKFTTTLILLMLFNWFVPIEKLHAQDSFVCELDFTLTSIGLCDDELGAVEVNISGGFGRYEVCWASNYNSIKETRVVNDSHLRISNLPTGFFVFKVTDTFSKCSKIISTLVDYNILRGTIKTKGNATKCNGLGSISVDITGNTPPYFMTVTGPITRRGSANGNKFKIYNLPMGDYEIKIFKGDCQQIVHSTVGVKAGSPNFELAAIKDDCGVDIGTVDASISGGKSPYQLSWEGPTEGSVEMNGDASISGLETGAYKFTLTDADGCSAFQFFHINATPLAVSAAKVAHQIDGQRGFVKLDVQGGISDFSVTWDGPESGQRHDIDRGEVISLPAGDFDLEVTDAAGCSEMISITVEEQVYVFEVGKIGGNKNDSQINSNLLLTEDKPFVHQNYPNPFDNRTTIQLDLPKSMEVELLVQDHFGRIVMTKRQLLGAGTQQFEINGSNLAPGMFFYTIITDGFKMTKRMVVR